MVNVPARPKLASDYSKFSAAGALAQSTRGGGRRQQEEVKPQQEEEIDEKYKIRQWEENEVRIVARLFT